MIFQNREEAAHLLAEKLKNYKGKNALVLGIPRGAMPMAQIIAHEIGAEFSAILVHKIPAPGYPELAIGAVGLSGHIFRLPTIEELGVPEEYVQTAAREQIRILKKRQQLFHLEELHCEGRTVIIVDDGIATGASAMGAIMEARDHKAETIVVATPTIAKSTAQEIRPMVDELVDLIEPEFFYAVSQFYSEFEQVSDEEVIQILGARSLAHRGRAVAKRGGYETRP